jgi:TonB family protein
VFFERYTIWRPFWLAEGVGEYFRKIGRNPDSKKISEKDGYPVADLFEIIPTKQYDDDAPATAFRIQSYRLLRVLLTQHNSAFRTFLEQLSTLEGQSSKVDIDGKALQGEFDSFSETLIAPAAGSLDIKISPLASGAMSIHRGDLLLAAKKISEAASWYQTDNAEARGARAILARFSRSGGEPIRLLSSAAASSPDAGLVLFHLGSIETKVPEDLQLQMESLKKAIALMPRFGRAHGQLARVNVLIGNGNEALAEADRALELEPEFADQFYLTRADAFLALGRLSDARNAATLAVALPHLDKSIDYDSKSSELARRVDEARQALDAKQLQKIRDEVDTIVAEREPPPPPPPPRPPERFGAIEYSVQSSRPIRIVNAPLPVYSNSLIQGGKAGNITVRVTIGADGKVTQASVVDSQLQEMNAPTIDAAKKWTFAPSTPPATQDARIVFRFSVQ